MQPFRTFLVACCLALSIPAVAQPQGTLPATQTVLTPTSAPASTFQSDVVGVLGHVQEELIGLEQAMPQNKFNWRPAKGVRSVAEVYLHAAGAGYFFGKMLGFEIPADIAAQMKTYEKSTTDKAKIEKALADSFAWFGNQVKSMPDSELTRASTSSATPPRSERWSSSRSATTRSTWASRSPTPAPTAWCRPGARRATSRRRRAAPGTDARRPRGHPPTPMDSAPCSRPPGR